MGSTSKARPPCRPIAVERRPPMLKDFLDANSCSSSGFNSFPRQPQPMQRSRSLSRAAADATISALQKLLNAVKSLPSVAVRPSTKKKGTNNADGVRVRVKDILRWKSFRELMDGHDYAGTPVVGGPMRPEALFADEGPTKEQERLLIWEDDDEEEQQSPVSVLESPILFRDQQHSSCLSTFDQSLANVERKRDRLLESIKWFESLSAGLDPTNLDDQPELEDSTEEDDEEEEEVNTKRCCHKRKELDSIKAYERKRRVVSYIEECVRDMEEEARWSKFEEHRSQLSSEVEMVILNALLDDHLSELVGGSDSESVCM